MWYSSQHPYVEDKLLVSSSNTDAPLALTGTIKRKVLLISVECVTEIVCDGIVSVLPINNMISRINKKSM